METRSNKFLVLVVTGFLLGTLLIFTLWLFDARDGDGNPYLIRFTGSVAGLEKGSPVTFSGVPAGHVTSIRFDKEDPSAVLVTVSLEPRIPVVAGVKASLARSALTGTANISLDGARSGAPPIVAANDGELPVIPAKEGGLLSGGGDPVALVEKISRTVDSVTRNLGAAQQQRASDRLAALAESSAGWADRAGGASDKLSGARGRVVAVGNALQRSGDSAQRLRAVLDERRATVLAKANRTLLNARDGAEQFTARVEAVRPTIRSATAKQAQLRETIRSARNKVGAVRDTAVRIDQEGLGVGAPSLPTYKPGSRQ
ncbi:MULTISPECIES: MlaD family protein [Sphingomonadales]|jgi:phospholipid/cholesterol/gamma-HCH transport system substrate-binding protein|uniref:MlaD family protein n=2 Tax=Sphingomonadaceae TaxID=41297 RepID=A0ABV6D1E7_9SPHN|nr:MlaD family protein [Novosphingobium profundi]MBA4771153.1 MCE family protein [Sphingobium sp.]MBT0671615.1 MCE family protein [Novosphingobium profundi]